MYGYSPTGFPNGTTIKIAVGNGGSAGDHTVVGGIEANDAIQQVLRISLTTGATTVTTISSSADLTSEFTDPCASDDTISNSGGTNTTGALIVCIYADADGGAASL